MQTTHFVITEKREKQMRKQKGFSLIELLIVVAIILIIAAIAIPNLLRARIAANESSAVSAVRTINTAEVSYQSAYPTVGYTTILAPLGPGAATCPAGGPTQAAACLIDFVLASATTAGTAKSGYYYDEVGVVGTGGTLILTYGVGAAPAAFNQTGVRNFCSSEDGVLHFNAGSAGATPQSGGSAACTGAAYPVLQ
jgi:type IV pilus assembly protein PilA